MVAWSVQAWLVTYKSDLSLSLYTTQEVEHSPEVGPAKIFF